LTFESSAFIISFTLQVH